MAGTALQILVRIVQRKSGIGMCEQRLRPVIGRVAVAALFAVAPLMIIVRQVTARAGAREPVFEIFASMAVLTLEAAVALRKGKTRFDGVVKVEVGPRTRCMTVAAACAVAAAMNIVATIFLRIAI